MQISLPWTPAYSNEKGQRNGGSLEAPVYRKQSSVEEWRRLPAGQLRGKGRLALTKGSPRLSSPPCSPDAPAVILWPALPRSQPHLFKPQHSEDSGTVSPTARAATARDHIPRRTCWQDIPLGMRHGASIAPPGEQPPPRLGASDPDARKPPHCIPATYRIFYQTDCWPKAQRPSLYAWRNPKSIRCMAMDRP
jgi:hypothetical protein